MDNGFDLNGKAAHFERVLMYAPGMLGNDALNFFLDRFKNQNWLGNSSEAWKRRKDPTKWGPVKNGKGRSLLVMRARLKRSLRILRAGNMEVVIGTDVPYAKAHNEGFRGILSQQVHAYQRRKKVNVLTKTGKTRMSKGRPVKRFGSGTVTVKAHTRKVKMNIPKRQFMGDSPYLTKQLSRRLEAELMKGLR